LLSRRDWKLVSAALGEMHDQLREDIPDEADFDRVFEELVANLIDRLGSPVVASSDQAGIYSVSANSKHREDAAAWLERRLH
jgi:hypothetical protein